MKIIFSKHAKLRCVQRKVSESWVKARLLRIPFSPGNHEHILEGTNLKVVFKDGESTRYVITVYVPDERMVTLDKPKKKVNLEPIVDLLKKEKKKFLRRKKNYKNLKNIRGPNGPLSLLEGGSP